MLKFSLVVCSIFFFHSCGKKNIETTDNGPYAKQNFSSLTLSKLQSNYSRWEEDKFKGSTILSWRLRNFSFSKTDFAGATIRDSIFDGGNFENCTFKDAYIVDSIFRNCIIQKANLDEAVLINVKFEDCRIL